MSTESIYLQRDRFTLEVVFVGRTKHIDRMIKLKTEAGYIIEEIERVDKSSQVKSTAKIRRWVWVQHYLKQNPRLWNVKLRKDRIVRVGDIRKF